MVLPDSHRVSRALWYSGTGPRRCHFRLRGYHPLCRDFPDPSTSNSEWRMAAPQPRRYRYLRFRLFPVRSPLLGESRLISLPPGTEMFHFPGSASCSYGFTAGRHHFRGDGLPHSEISGSMFARQLPGAYRSRPRPSSLASAKALAACPS